MKTLSRAKRIFQHLNWLPARVLMVAGFLFALLPAARAVALLGPGGTNNPYFFPLDSWSFYDSTNWPDDYGDLPVSFTNLDFS